MMRRAALAATAVMAVLASWAVDLMVVAAHAQPSATFVGTGRVSTRYNASSASLHRVPDDYSMDNIVRFVGNGTTVTILDRYGPGQGGHFWYKVRIPGGVDGWLRDDDLVVTNGQWIPTATLSTSSALPAPPPSALKAWQGSGSRATESFAVSTSEWRIRWTATDEMGSGGSIFITVYQAGGMPVATASSSAAAETQETVVHHGPGRYYLQIDAVSWVRWRVWVEEM